MFLIFTCLVLGSAYGQSTWRQAGWVSDSTDPKQLEFQLITIEPGDELYTWWGHSALVVTDRSTRESRFYNYGLFSFSQTNFFTNFAMGRLWFEVQAIPTQPALEQYRRINRTIRIQTLNVPVDLRLEIARFLETNILPENRQYLYDHYWDNCATRVRDILDTASRGALKASSGDEAGTTFRRITRRFSGAHFLADTLLMYLMGGSIDSGMTRWETMFLPTELELQLDQVVVTNSRGETVPFVQSRETWYQATGRDAILETAPSPLPLTLCIGVVLGAAVFFTGFFLRRRQGGHRIAHGVTSSLIGLIFGVPGTILAFMTLFTDHTVTYWNENLILTHPLILAALPLGVLGAVGKRRAQTIMSWLWFLQTAIVITYALFKLFSVLNQENWQFVILTLPVYAALSWPAAQALFRQKTPGGGPA